MVCMSIPVCARCRNKFTDVGSVITRAASRTRSGREGQHLPAVAVDQLPVQHKLDEVAKRLGVVHVGHDDRAARPQPVIKQVHQGLAGRFRQIIKQAAAINQVVGRFPGGLARPGVLAQEVMHRHLPGLDGGPG